MKYDTIAMNCPICQQPMRIIKQDISYNPKDNNKAFDRSHYNCETDDVWLVTEIPQNKTSNELA